jgi:hypothetical protein
MNPSDYLLKAPAKSSTLRTGEHISHKPTIHRYPHISSSDTPGKGSRYYQVATRRCHSQIPTPLSLDLLTRLDQLLAARLWRCGMSLGSAVFQTSYRLCANICMINSWRLRQLSETAHKDAVPPPPGLLPSSSNACEIPLSLYSSNRVPEFPLRRCKTKIRRKDGEQ